MTTSPMSEALLRLRTAALRGGAGLSDAQLLEYFLASRDDSAFRALMRRHGPMVWGVCRRVLGNHHDAEDAFQATFLVLVRKAESVGSRELLANWLYGVAYRVALKARATSARRRVRERQVASVPEPEARRPAPGGDLLPLIDRELSRLPARYRAPVVLCDLQGKTRKEAARELGCPEGTVAGQLARARRMLARRLARHGVAVSGAALAAYLSQGTATAAVPAAVAAATVRAAALLAAGHAVPAGVVSAKAAALADGALRAMLLAKVKAGVAVALAGCLLCAGAALRPGPAAGRDTAAAVAVAQAREDKKPAESPPPPRPAVRADGAARAAAPNGDPPPAAAEPLAVAPAPGGRRSDVEPPGRDRFGVPFCDDPGRGPPPSFGGGSEGPPPRPGRHGPPPFDGGRGWRPGREGGPGGPPPRFGGRRDHHPPRDGWRGAPPPPADDPDDAPLPPEGRAAGR